MLFRGVILVRLGVTNWWLSARNVRAFALHDILTYYIEMDYKTINTIRALFAVIASKALVCKELRIKSIKIGARVLSLVFLLLLWFTLLNQPHD